jgi:hypothetical protein
MMRLRQYVPGSLRSLRRSVLDRLGRRWETGDTSYDPYDRAALQTRADEMFLCRQGEHPAGTIDRSRLLLEIIEAWFPTPTLEAAYFANLDLMLRGREKLDRPGRLVLGLGSGRSGSTTLAALLATVERSCCTHENPPLIFWTPDQAQTEFHIRRFRLLCEYYSLIADVSHWWLSVLDTFFQHFPDSRAVGLVRDTDECAKSFMRVKGYGRGSLNHWVSHGNGIWAASSWDPVYPSYTVPAYARDAVDCAKLDLIRRYVGEYNDRLVAVVERLPDRILLLRTEELNRPATQKRIFEFAGVQGRIVKLNLNVRDFSEGRHNDFRF